ncbi:FHA domain-containing protein [Dactylosporangium sp. AC04546]|uniref:FHA domain-containing protein n=1 Tax=Dactylosporangium sp. AC04546 TaxID=2862460 RepID=UPI001EDF7A68|nr:FHA domain-containing protein [Dactylosporangium sp. AC04546]WVK86398.1 FHA domain-containing protein [Dactylosporangium sp. AC04546]
MDDHLTADVSTADYVLDLSNILRNTRLGGTAAADVRRLARVRTALQQHDNDDDLRFYAVADGSLFSAGLHQGDRDGLRRLRRWRDRGLVEVVPDADGRILEISEVTGLRIVSGDRFRNWRDQYGWLQGNHDRVVEVIPGEDGAFRVRAVEMGFVSDTDMSRLQEQDQFKRQGLLAGERRRPRFDVVSRLWRCADQRCHLYDGRGVVVMLPRLIGGVATCEIHRTPLTDAGPRPLVAQLKVLVDGACAARFPLPEGSAVAVGRAPGAGGVSLARLLGGESVGTDVSRTHVRLRLLGERVLVRDQSTYGTKIRRPAGPDAPVSLEHDVEYVLQREEVLLLNERISLTRSGRSFPSELTARWSAADSSSSPVTRTADGTDPPA